MGFEDMTKRDLTPPETGPVLPALWKNREISKEEIQNILSTKKYVDLHLSDKAVRYKSNNHENISIPEE
jgi:hypothetical protein